ncbi:tyrosine-type recombinase/integrase [Micromonospora sp. NPDC050417]|uniref:tyrosine-type recombinase/integrase n=1 Tax=Micromonospora sp. NPDC050417 TaxID=3364280 RepID=UPI00379F11AE
MWIEKNGPTWRVREKIGDKKVTLAGGYETKTAARKALTIMRADALRGDLLVPRGREMTVSELCETWWQDIGPTFTRIKTRESMRGVLNRYIVRLLGDHTLGFLEDNPAVVQGWVNDLLAGRTKPARGAPRRLAPKTVRNAHGLLSQVMKWAITSRKLIRSNPCGGTRLPDEVFTEHYYLTPAEADRLIAALPEHWRPLVLFLLATGCRWSEALGVRAKHLAAVPGKVTFVKKRIEDEHGQFHDEDIKSRRGRRTVSLTELLNQVLVPLVMVEGDRDRLIFRAIMGGDIRHKEFYVVWHKATEAAGLAGLRVHDLRHTHVAWLIAGNVHISAISRRLGHKNISVTDGTYGHLLDMVDVRLVQALEEAMQVIDFRGLIGDTDPLDPRRTPLVPA